jgi:hypothetical protein
MSLIGTIRARQLSQLGIDHIDVGTTPDMPPAKLSALMDDINAVAQHLFLNGPGAFWGEGPQGDRLRAPATLSAVTSTDGSKTVACASFAAYMHGCTIRFNGEWNRLFQTGASIWELMIPSNVTSSSGTMVVYHDCLNLTDTSLALSKVILDNYWELDPVNNLADLEIPFWNSLTVKVTPPSVSFGPWGRDRQIDTPRQYGIDGTQLYGGSYVTQLRVNPLPNAAYPIHWTQREKFNKVTAWSDARTVIIPHGYDESVFIPLVLERLLGRADFEGDKAVIAADADRARKVMEDLSAPQQRNVRLITRGVW